MTQRVKQKVSSLDIVDAEIPEEEATSNTELLHVTSTGW